MTDPTKSVTGSFPDYTEAIASLNEPGSHFNALCHEFDQVAKDLSRLDAAVEADSGTQAEQLRKRRDSLAQELLAMMQQTQRV